MLQRLFGRRERSRKSYGEGRGNTELQLRGGKAMQIVEQLAGVGNLSEAGKSLGERHYEIVVFQRASGLKGLRGRITPKDIHESSDFVIRDAELVLTLEDGRALDCYMFNNRGDILNRGKGLYKP
jgi:hypothetical protein